MARESNVTWLVVGGLAALGLLVLRPVRVDRGVTFPEPPTAGKILPGRAVPPTAEKAVPRTAAPLTGRRRARSAPRIRVSPPPSRDADTWFTTGLACLNAGNSEGAIDAFLQATRLEPDWARAHHNLGFAYDQAGRYGEAVAAYKVAILLDPDEPETRNNLGSVYVKLDRYEEAVTEFRSAIDLQPDHAEAHLNLGLAYLLLHRLDDARDTHRALAALNPRMADELERFIQQAQP